MMITTDANQVLRNTIEVSSVLIPVVQVVVVLIEVGVTGLA